MLGVISVCIVALFVVSISHWVYRWSNPKCNGTLPPGSMGWPLLGETSHFLAPSRTWDLPAFIKNRTQRYGSVFRTSLLGWRVIVSTDSELSYMVFQQGRSFESWYPQSMAKLFGKQMGNYFQGSLHKYVKNMVLTVVGSENLKKIFSEVESVAARHMEEWARKETVELKTAFADLVFEFMGKKLISYDPAKSSENLRENFEAFIHGLYSLPLEIPGTVYYKCLQGRKKVIMMLKNMLQERRANPNNVKNDFFDYVLGELQQNDTKLTEDVALDLIFVLLFANFEAISKAIILAIKFLTDNPKALKELSEEHEKILGKRENPETGLTWEEYKSMTFTFQIINETLRLGNIAPVLFRTAATDIKFKDYTIPSGWVVMTVPPAVHLDPDIYKDPLDFNPWRWEGMDLKGASKTFMAFGGGLRLCVGADFAKLQISIFLHFLATRYRWKLIKGGSMVRTAALEFPDGFHVQFFEKYKKNQHLN